MQENRPSPGGFPGFAPVMTLVETLSTAFGPSGFEDEVRRRILDAVHDLDVHTVVDVLGNLSVALNPGTDFTVMLDAHMDEVGLMISGVEPEGILRFALLGGWDPRVLPSHQVELRSTREQAVMGVIGVTPPHLQSPEDQKKAYAVEHLAIDLGCSDSAEVESLGIRMGAPGVLTAPFLRLHNGVVSGKALDDRVGCALLVALVRHFARFPVDFTLVANFSVKEEIGARGAATAAYRIRPDLAFAVEGTTGDTPGVPPASQSCFLGKGPAITLADKSILVKPSLVETLSREAQLLGIPFQYKRPLTGGTDAGPIHLSRAGVLTAVIGVPCRYLHSPVSAILEEDVFHTFRLLLRLVEQARSIGTLCAP